MIRAVRPEEPSTILEEGTDHEESARLRAQMERFQKNSNWLQDHWGDLLPQALGKFIAVAGQEAFIGDTTEEAWTKAKASHPEDDGAFSQYVIPHKGPRIYVDRG
jgi:hypothetical protein